MSPASSPAEANGTLKKGLHQDGRRMTPQRRLVLDLFEQIGSGSHLSAEEVHRQLVDQQSKVSLATIYRTLRLLVEMDFLQELELREGSRFELADAEHSCLMRPLRVNRKNLKVKRCFSWSGTPRNQLIFELIDSSLNVQGICPDCRWFQWCSAGCSEHAIQWLPILMDPLATDQLGLCFRLSAGGIGPSEDPPGSV